MCKKGALKWTGSGRRKAERAFSAPGTPCVKLCYPNAFRTLPAGHAVRRAGLLPSFPRQLPKPQQTASVPLLPSTNLQRYSRQPGNMGGDDQVVKDFFHYVNMTADELKEWLDNPTSMNTGQAAEDGEPKGEDPQPIMDALALLLPRCCCQTQAGQCCRQCKYL